jgi:UDP-N-acetylglucosamine 3-dehydrogenase
MRVGIIGVGAMGQHHARIYSELPDVDLVGVADIDFERAQNIATQYNTKAYGDYKELLNQELDAVSIASPTSEHEKIALSAIRMGVNLLIEKPIADTVHSAQGIVAAAEAIGIKIMVGHIERFNPVITKLKEIIDEGVLGELLCLSVRRVGPFVSRVIDAGIIVDVATHDIDVIRYLVGSECTSIFARSTNYRNKKGDTAIILMGFGDISASVEVNWYTPHKVRTLTGTGTGGIAYVDYIKQELEIYNEESKIVPYIDKREPLKLELEHFLDCIRNNKDPITSGYDGLKTLEIATKAEQFADSINRLRAERGVD